MSTQVVRERDEGPAPASVVSGDASSPVREVSLLWAMTAVLRHYRLLLALALVPAFIAGVLGLTSRRTYTSAASFMPQSGQGGNALGGASSLIAAKLGVGNLAGASESQFYADLIKSHEVLRELVNTPIEARDSDGRVHHSLIQLYGYGQVDSLVAVERSIQQIRAAIGVKPSSTGVVEVKVTASEPRLAAFLSGRLIELLNDFNLRRRQSQAGAERQFVAARLEEARKELAATEQQLDDFLEHNRLIAQSPRLQFEQDRMLERVKARQEVVTTLMQGYEQARIDEIRNTPVITVVEPPIIPIVPNPRGTTQRVLTALIAGLVIGLAIVFMLEVRRSLAAGASPEFHEFTAAWRDIRWDLRHPIRGLAARGPRRRYGGGGQVDEA